MRGERALLVVVFVVSAALRVVAVDRPLDMDEALWVQRGGAFFGALLEGRLAGTYLRPHPGVVSMWVLGAADLGWCRATAAPGVPETWRTCANRVAAEPFPSLPFFIVGRCLQAFLSSAAVAAICLLAGRLFGARVGWLAAAVLALEPFFVGFQRFVTTDALAADLAALAWLLFLLHLRAGGRARLVVSGVALGMAALTKVPTILIAPALVAWMALVESGVWPGYEARGWRVRLPELALWGGAAAATVFVLWPALWVAPLSTFQRFRFDLIVEKTEGSHLFVATDERPWIFYPLVLLWRLSPFLQAGCLLGLFAMIGRRWRGRAAAAGIEPLALLALSSLLLLRLAGDTARDRYLMFVVPPLAVLSALGWEGLARWLQARTGRAAVAPLLVAAVAVGQSALLLCYAPDYVTYYNPLLGGAAAASRVMALGQGEGLDRAARWLNGQPGAELQVVSSGLPWAFAPYFYGRTVPISMTGGSRDWLRSDRIVIYVWQVQVGIPDPLSASYIWSQPPLHAIRLHGVDYVRIYRGPIVLPETLEPMGSTASP